MTARRVLRALAGAALLLVLLAAAGAGLALHAVSPATGAGDLLDLVRGPAGGPGTIRFAIQHDQRVNVLLLAHGGAGGDNPDYTDTLIVVSIRPATRDVTVLSLPRHLWVSIPATPNAPIEGKLYVAYALAADAGPGGLDGSWSGPTGPGDLAAATVSGVIGQPVPYWISVDTASFGPLIDDLGGITLDIPQALDDPAYPTDEEGHVMHVHFDAGVQRLDGTQALEYARSRLSTSDADRSRRQELVVAGILDSLRHPRLGLTAPLSVFPLTQGLRTNLRPTEMHDLADLFGGVREQDVTRASLQDSGLLVQQPLGDSDIFVPQDGTFAAVRSYVAALLP